MHNSTSRFSDRVDNYIKYRPDYPTEIIPYLQKEIGFNSTTIIADIGSGTGISAELFLKNGNQVFGVEPNKEMREAAEKLLGKYELFISINGSAEQTTLPENSIDLIVAAQAFHWFDMVAFKDACQYIAKRVAYCVLIWNERLENTAFLQDYEALIVTYATDYAAINHKNIAEETISQFYQPNKFRLQSFKNEQSFDFDGLLGRLASSSYMPTSGSASFIEMKTALSSLFKEHQVANKVIIHYETKLYIGKISI